jgi:hypothetical protein
MEAPEYQISRALELSEVGANLIFSLYFSLLAGKTKPGERFAADY